jgi:hypothetical protein
MSGWLVSGWLVSDWLADGMAGLRVFDARLLDVG